ncbi:threonine--tRNA ligase [Acidimicrobiaceae bacterium]|nr:threonine--tRNA ligase [Acidimicrobiaceae bacterium]
MIKITLPDKSVKEFDSDIDGIGIAKSISNSLAKSAVCIDVNGELKDLSYVIKEDSKCKIYTKQDKYALDTLRHSTAHVLAQAVLNLFPGTELAVGPSIEDGFYYDFLFKENIKESDLSSIENEMRRINKANQLFIREEISINDAKNKFLNQQFKQELITTADPSEGVEGDNISIYKNDNFEDLCRGPHVPSTSQIIHFKLTKLAGAYWRGIETNPQLQRIYGTAWFSKEDLDNYLARQKEAEKRDHRKLGNELDLFVNTDEIGPGQFLWKPKGSILRQNIEDYSKKAHADNGYEYAYTPHIGRSVLWETSGHLDYYKEGMYPPLKNEGNEDDEYYLKPMNCPFHILIYKSDIRSYKELPLRFFELGSVYRYEKTGVLHGLLRARGFTQDDAHIFCTSDQIEEEILNLLTFSIKLLNAFGFDSIEADLSTRPEKSIGNENDWVKATNSLASALDNQNISYVTAHGEGAFYGPKIDLHVKDAIGRRWQLSTIQVDFSQPDNFDLQYVDSNNKRIRPVMIHRALLGSIERFTGILIENYAGHFPGWLAPVQVRILTIGEVSNYVEEIVKSLKNVRLEIDDRSIRLGEKIHDSTKQKVPISIIIGEKDVSSQTMALNIHNQDNQKDIKLEDGIKQIKNVIKVPKFKL